MKIIALIPARAGSKGIINKNLSLVGNTSLLQRKIENAKGVVQIEEIYVSSDSEEILAIALEQGVKIVKRPMDISGDSANANQVVYHFLTSSLENSSPEDILVYLQPTSPFTKVRTISNMLNLCVDSQLPVVAVRQVKEHPSKMLKLCSESSISLYEENGNPTKNRQDLEKLFIATGGCYVFRVSDFLNSGEIPVRSALAFEVDETEGFDIDLPIDLITARELDKYLNE